ncbi:nucleoside-diphosphate kinase [Martelella mangrovi]|uniref:Nucleoside diphosphate kinase n=1 Tax=Martelella mangrovi TaxID=1397477 RepID=A0ABV2IEN8_9HYPH
MDHFIEKYRANSDLLKFRRRDEVLTNIIESFGLEVLKAFENVQLLILKPDAVCSGKALGITEFLVEHGVEVLGAWPLFSLSEHHYEELYRYNIDLDHKKPMVGAVWHLRNQFVDHPSIACLITTTPGIAERQVYEVTRSLKGDSTPLMSQSGQIRFDFNGASKAMNLVHMSDDPISTLRELRVFFKEDFIRGPLHTLCDRRRTDDTSRSTMFQAARCVPTQTTDADFPAATLRVLLMITSQLATEAPPFSKHIESFDLPAAHNGPRERLLALDGFFQTLVKKDFSTFCPATSLSFRANALLQVSKVLLEMRSWDTQRIRYCRGVLKSFDMTINEWDFQMLFSNAVFNDALKAALQPITKSSTPLEGAI